MGIGHTLRVLGATMRTAWREATANRVGLWSQVSIMVLNDIVWVVFWVLLFNRVGEVRGWDVDRIVLLLAVFTTNAGIVMGLFHNLRRIGELVVGGGLDALLVLPTSPLAHLMARRIETVFLGDIGFGIVLFAVAGNPTPAKTAVFVFAVVCAAMVVGGFLIIVGSLSFFASRDDAADLGLHAMLAFGNYPVDMFGGVLRVILYGVIPAAFVTSVPAKLVDDFRLGWAITLAAVALFVAGLAVALFTFGLRRYTSGAVWVPA